MIASVNEEISITNTLEKFLLMGVSCWEIPSSFTREAPWQRYLKVSFQSLKPCNLTRRQYMSIHARIYCFLDTWGKNCWTSNRNPEDSCSTSAQDESFITTNTHWKSKEVLTGPIIYSLEGPPAMPLVQKEKCKPVYLGNCRHELQFCSDVIYRKTWAQRSTVKPVETNYGVTSWLKIADADATAGHTLCEDNLGFCLVMIYFCRKKW